jgi:hypothetical protein
MNKIMCILFLLLLFSCGNSISTNDNVSNTKISNEIKLDNKSVEFIADTTINKKLFLENYQSIETYFGSNDLKLVEQLRSSPVAVFSNKGKNEYLLAYQYEGGTKNAFSCFEFGKLSELQNVTNTSIMQIDIESFNTESSLQLGQSIEDVKRIKGNAFTETIEANEKTIMYKIEDTKSDFLKRYNMPSYFLKLTFDSTEKIKRIIFGFDYP